MINDSHNGEVTGIRLAAGRLTGGRAAHADHPVAWLGANGIDCNLFGTAIQNYLEMLVLEIGNSICGDERLDDLDDEHDQ